jgi:hypothetical protein
MSSRQGCRWAGPQASEGRVDTGRRPGPHQAPGRADDPRPRRHRDGVRHPTAALTLVRTPRSFHGHAPRRAWPSTAAAGRWPAPGSGTLGCQGVWAPTAAGLPCVAPAHPSASGGAAARWSACRVLSQCQATTVPPQNSAALPRNASRRLTSASTPLSIGLTAEPIYTPLCKTPKALAR